MPKTHAPGAASPHVEDDAAERRARMDRLEKMLERLVESAIPAPANGALPATEAPSVGHWELHSLAEAQSGDDCIVTGAHDTEVRLRDLALEAARAGVDPFDALHGVRPRIERELAEYRASGERSVLARGLIEILTEIRGLRR